MDCGEPLEWDWEQSLKTAIQLGISVSEYDEMTPRQLKIIADTKREQQEEDAKDKLTLAYLNSMWTIQWLGKRNQHPKPLAEILKGIEPKVVMTDEDMLSVVKNLNAMFGGEVKI